MPIKNWSTTPGSNTSAPPYGAPESSTKIKDYNDVARQIMADTRTMCASATVASAATCDLSTADEFWQTITGTTTITSFGTLPDGLFRFVTFSGALTLTHNATSLILLGGVNRTTAAGDCALYKSLGSGNWKEYFFSPIGAYQPLDAQLTTLAGITSQQATDLAAVSTYIGTLLNDADADAAKATLVISTQKGANTYLTDTGTIATSQAATATAASAITNSGEVFNRSSRNGSVTGNNIYDPIFPSVGHYDNEQSIIHIPAGSTTTETISSVAAYIKNDSTLNGVGLFSCGMGTVTGAKNWGLNTLLQDNATRATHVRTGQVLIGGELDFNVMGTATEVIGLSVGGNSLAQPTSANGFMCNVLGTGFKWTTAFNSQDAAATYALNAGMTALSGASVESQYVLFQYTTAASVKQNISIRAEAGGYLSFSGSVAPLGYAFKGASVFLDAGMSLRIGGNGVVGERKTGWTAATGTATRTTYATSTVTLPQLAERVKALTDDLISHGLIGT